MTETPWPIDPFRPTSGSGYRQRVYLEAEVYDDPDPEDDDPDTRFYTFAISTGDPHTSANDGRELVSIREGHVRKVVQRIPAEPDKPGHIVARLLRGFEVQVFGEWRRVVDVDHRDGFVALALDGLTITVPAYDRIPVRLPEGAQ